MILYDLQGDDLSHKIQFKPKTCFLVTQMGKPIPQKVKNIRSNLEKCLKQRNFNCIDADSELRGKDFLYKI